MRPRGLETREVKRLEAREVMRLEAREVMRPLQGRTARQQARCGPSEFIEKGFQK